LKFATVAHSARALLHTAEEATVGTKQRLYRGALAHRIELDALSLNKDRCTKYLFRRVLPATATTTHLSNANYH